MEVTKIKNDSYEFELASNKDEVLAALGDAVYDWLDGIGEDAAGTAAKKAPVDTGELKNSISHAVVKSEDAVYIGTNVPYAKWHEFGTGAYAEGGGGRKKPWAFKDRDGKWHYTKGVPAKHFIQFGATAHLAEYKKILEDMLKG